MFNCDRCGACCREVGKSELYKHLDGGDGSCKFLDQKTNDCIIYDYRPLICRVDEGFKIMFSDKYSLEEFYHLNKMVCFRYIKKGAGKMDETEIKKKLSKRFMEICREGIVLSYGRAYCLDDDTLSGKLASNARDKICKGRVSSSDIIGVLDTSMFESAKSGLAFTTDTLFCSCFENTDSKFSIKYGDIDFISYDNFDEDNIFLEIYRKHSTENYKINMTWFSKKKIKWFLDEAKELYDNVNDDELDWDKL